MINLILYSLFTVKQGDPFSSLSMNFFIISLQKNTSQNNGISWPFLKYGFDKTLHLQADDKN